MSKEWMKKHGDTIAVIVAMLACFGWLRADMQEIRQDIKEVRVSVESLATRVGAVEKEVAVIKTVLIMRDVMPKEYAGKE